MATDHHMNDFHAENVEVSYEPRDLGARGILLFFAILIVTGVVVHFVVWGVYGAMGKVVASMEPEQNPMQPPAETPKAVMLQNTPMVDLNKFAHPRLQSDEPADMATFNWQEEQLLRSDAWIDDKGTVHVPIDVAKEELLKRGLPTRSPGGSATPGTVQSLSSTPAVSAPQTTPNKPKS